ncbi:hypothetical protein RvY_08935 [Ramazzottius varieornatus]|uniref:Dynamin-like GTPase OPA1, mitochondrial n=1 Tax=Ramazzottius varieornatus TaxID=947166 RepID=A0A1D1VC69_RAMVA|nr:hypothetical protein RvY_08935 [Ramazzottius varieornatus]
MALSFSTAVGEPRRTVEMIFRRRIHRQARAADMSLFPHRLPVNRRMMLAVLIGGSAVMSCMVVDLRQRDLRRRRKSLRADPNGKDGYHSSETSSSSHYRPDTSMSQVLQSLGSQPLFFRPVFCEAESAAPAPVDGSGDQLLAIEDKIQAVQAKIVEEQVLYQQRIFKLEKENLELRRQIMLRQEGRDLKSRKLKRNPIEMFSEVLDDLVELRAEFGLQVVVPQVMVVGDPNSGKSSLIEMLVKTRIFPRTEATQQIPIKFTICEGPYHLAQFNDSDREFDLENPADLEELRKQFEIRLKSAATKENLLPLVSLTIWGPGLSNMILVDLPTPQSTGTGAAVTPDRIRNMYESFLQNPQSLFLCLVDASRESEYSRTVELVKDFDPDGKRSMFVLTKPDLVETSMANPEKMKRIASGAALPLKAAALFSVIPGRGPKSEPLEDVEKFEAEYFASSDMFKSGAMKQEQLSTRNMSRKMSEIFWQHVKTSLRYQIDFLKSRKAVLEKSWKTHFNKARVLDRDELYETGRMQLLDDVIRLQNLPQSTWENDFEERLWTAMADYVFTDIYVPAASGNRNDLKVVGDLRLKNWADVQLPLRSLEIASDTLKQKFQAVATRSKTEKDHDDIFDHFKQTVVEETFKVHQWDSVAREALRSALINSCEAPYIITPDDWNSAVHFMETACADRLAEVQNRIREMLGPASWEVLLLRRPTKEQSNRRAVVDKLEQLVMPKEAATGKAELSKDEINVVLKTLESQNVKVDPLFIRETWHFMFLSRFLEQAIQKVALCGDISDGGEFSPVATGQNDCADVDLFYRVKKMIRSASVALRQQLTAAELNKLEVEVKQILDGLERSPAKIKEFFNHPRIGLAEELKKITNLQEKLDDLSKMVTEGDDSSSFRAGRNSDHAA